MAEHGSITVKLKADTLATMESVKEIVRDALLQYSEWLDADQCLIRNDEALGDTRTHDDLVTEFLGSR